MEKDTTYEIEGINFLVHEKDEPYFNGKKVDYVRNVLGMGQFRVI